MSLTVSNKGNGGGNYDPIPEGSYVAVCYMMVDLGIQNNEKFGSSARKVLIGWEIPEETMEYNGETVPRVISKQYTLSLNEKSRLYKDLVSWRGREFTAEELKGFDLKKIVGTSCLLNVIHKESANGKVYANVGSIMALPKGMPKGELSGLATVFDLDVDDLAKVESLPEWIGNMIKNSETYMDRAASAIQAKVELKPIEEDDDSDLPF